MKKYKVYLAGAISHLTYDAGQEWRATAIKALADLGIVGYSPLRRKDYLRKYGDLPPVINQDKVRNPLSTNKGIVTRDYNDVATSDAILVNLLGAEKISVGTCIEIGWAWQLRLPLVAIIEPSGNIHSHAFIDEMISYRYDTLEDGIDAIGHILLP